MKELDQFTVERLTTLSVSENLPEVAALARIALAAKKSQPVQWWTGPEPTSTGEMESFHDHETGSHYIPLIPALGSLNYPAVPDGWVMVPKVPTEEMIVDGFESEPDKYFSDKKEWKAYKEMSGCQQAAHRAKLCWVAMLAAAPKSEK